jgi:hypothetical protein
LIRQLTGHQCLFECSAHLNTHSLTLQQFAAKPVDNATTPHHLSRNGRGSSEREAYRSVHDGDLDPRRLSAVRVARRARDRRSKSHGEMRDVRWVTGS